jgi:hypothetical protein
VATKEMLTLENLGGGAASEMFSGSLEKVIENIVNPNTKADTVRTITLKMKIKPDKKQRTLCVVELSCEEKLAAVLPFETVMFVGMDQVVAVATEYSPQQQTLFDQSQQQQETPKGDGKVIAMAGGR